MIHKNSVKKYQLMLKRTACVIIAAALVFGSFACAPFDIKADAAANLKFGDNYRLTIDLEVTNDADGWNSAWCKVWTRPKNGTGSEHLFKEYDIKDSVDNGDDTWSLTEDLGTEFPSDIEIYTDFGGGFTWRAWAAEVTIKVNGINVKSSHLISESGCFSSSNTHNHLYIDTIHFPWPKTINVLNHHTDIPGLPDEDNFYDFYQGAGAATATGNIFINACDVYGVTWYGSKGEGGYANSVTSDGDPYARMNKTSGSTYSEGSIYKLYCPTGSSGKPDHETTYTFTFNTGNESHSKVTRQVKVYFYFNHKLTVKVKNKPDSVIYGFRGDFIDLDEIDIPAGYSVTGYDQEGDGTYDDDANQFTFASGNCTLTAALKANKYKIAFDGNGATGGTMTAVKNATYDVPLQVPANVFSKSDGQGNNYKFAGWNTRPDGSGISVANKGFAVNLTPNNGEIVTLYAQWKMIGWDLILKYPPEMEIEDRLITVSKLEGQNFFTPEPVILTETDDNDRYHYVYRYADQDLSEITGNMTVNLTYEKVSHSFSKNEVIEMPTCPDANGNGGYGQGQVCCAGCGYLDHQYLILPLSHRYDEPEWDWSITYSEATARFTCMLCGHVETVRSDSTCSDEEHMRVFTVSADFEGKTYTDSESEHINHISFDLNGGSGSLETRVVYDGEFELPDLDPSAYKQYADFTGWKIGDTVYQPGDTVEAGDFTAVAQWEISWSDIQAVIDSAGSSTSILLTEDLIASPGDGPLTIPAGKAITIHLNGHKIDRSLSSPAADGSVFKITGGILSVYDEAGGGTITGGYTSGNGGGVDVESGSFWMYSGEISYNRAEGNGGGVYVSGNSDGAAFNLRGGTVCQNICGGSGSGVYASGADNELYISGSAEITKNVCTGDSMSSGGVYADIGNFKINDRIKIHDNYKADESRSNVVLGGNTQMVVWYPLESSALVYISGEPGRVYVHDSNVDDDPGFNPDLTNYRSDSFDFDPALNADKEVIFVSHTHIYTGPVWVWSDDCTSAQAVFTCTGCEDTQTVEAAVTQTGNTNTHLIYTAEAAFEDETYSDTAQKAKGWNMHVSGIQVTGDNCNDILGDGTVKYDVASNTLTLTDAVIETALRSGDNENEFGLRYNVNRGARLKIVLNGTNSIVNTETAGSVVRVFGIAVYNANSSVDCNPLISGSGTLNITLGSDGLTECIGIHSSGSALTVNESRINIGIDGSSPSQGIHANNSIVVENGAQAIITTGSGSGTVSLYARSLSVSEDSSVKVISAVSAVSSVCSLTDSTLMLGIDTAPDISGENSAEWDRSTSLSSYKYVHIRYVERKASAELSADRVVKGQSLTWTVKVPDDTTWVRFSGTYTDSAGNPVNLTLNYKRTNTAVVITDEQYTSLEVWTVDTRFSYAGTGQSSLQNWSVQYKPKGSKEWLPVMSDGGESELVKTVLVGKTADVLVPPTQGYDKYSLISAVSGKESVSAGERSQVTVMTTDDVSKIRICYVDAATGKTKSYAFQTTSTSVKSLESENGISTWVIDFKFIAPAVDSTYSVQCRGTQWGEAQTFTVTVK